MDLRRLAHFVAVAEAKNISHAARRVHLSQPTLSRQIQALERDFGISLFERDGRVLRLTAVGHDVLERARKLIEEADALSERAKSLKGGDVGLLRVGAPAQILERVLPSVLARFRADKPGVEIRLKEEHAKALNDLLRQGELDLALMPAGPEVRASSRPAGVLYIAAVAKAPLSRDGKSIELGQLDGLSLLVPARGFGSRDLFDATCEIARVRPRVIFESRSSSTLLALARAGYGVAIVPTTIALPRGLRVNLVAHRGRALCQPFAVHWNPRRPPAPYALRFAELWASQARALFAR